MQLFLFIVNAGASLHADEVSKWNRFELNMKHPLVGTVSSILAVALFIGSYFVSVKIYRHKEFG